MDGVTHRIYTKALGNEIALAVGTSLSAVQYSIPSLAHILAERGIELAAHTPPEYYSMWNKLVRTATQASSAL
jgi:hypothetical protein